MLNKPEIPIDPNNFHLDLILIIKDKISGNSAEIYFNFYSENYRDDELEESKFKGFYLKTFSWKNLESELKIMVKELNKYTWDDALDILKKKEGFDRYSLKVYLKN